MVYLENRAFLPAGDVLCSDRKHFPSKDPVPLSPPQLKTTEFVDSHNGQLAAASTSAARHEVMRRSGCTGAYSLRSLPFHDRLLNTPVEPMHLLKNISERIVNIISGVTDTAKVRNEEKNLSRFKMSWVKMVERNGKQVQCIPEAPFSLKKNELIIANRRAMNIVAPSGIDWKPRKLFGKGVSHMKSVEWRHVVSSGILKFCIRGLLGREQRKTLTELCNVIHLLCAETVSLRDLDSIEYQVHRVLSLLERDFPVTIQVISVHLLHHLPMFVKRFGPLYGFWMYPMERFNSWIGRRVLNRRYPEATVMATYRIYEFTFFLELSGHLPIGSTTDVHGSGEDESLPHQPSDAETEHHNSDANHGCSSRLEPDAVKDLDSYYATTYPEYGHLLSRYKKEKCIAKRNKDIRCFPPLSKWIPTSGPPLSVIEMRLRAGPNDTVTLYKVYTTKDKHRRSVRYGSMIAETSSTVRVSSYVHLRSDQAIDCEAFGRIKYIFCSNFNGNTHVLAYIHWYKKSTTDLESGLKYFQLSSHNKSMPAIVPLTALSKPLIHALDEDNPDRLWIINC